MYLSTGDTKAGTLIAKDRYGNKYFENLEEELPCKIIHSFAHHCVSLTYGFSENSMGRLCQ